MDSPKLTPSQKFAQRVEQWKSPEGLRFVNPDVQHSYERRVQMIVDALAMKIPERVPVHIGSTGFYAFIYAGVPHREAMYDYDKLAYVMKKFHADFLPDTLAASPLFGPGRVFDILDYQLYRWPGHGLEPNRPYQYIETEYMHEDEYDLFLKDPTDFFLRFYLPRVFKALTPWEKMGSFTDILELPFSGGSFVPFGLPAVADSFKKLLEAGQAAAEWAKACAAIDNATITTLGICRMTGGFTKAPFDTLGDTLRSTRAIMLDKFRRPNKLIAAMERLVPIAIDLGVRTATARRVPVVFIPLHKGADGFMSQRDFQTFYWPTLKAVILGLIEQGLVPYLFVEGTYNQRLDLFPDPDIPAGTTLWMFDQSDMNKVKQRLSGWACFGGNVPTSLLKAGTPEQVTSYVKRLLDEVAQDGGFILAPGAAMEDARAENLHAMLDTGKQHGVYRHAEAGR